MKVKILHDKAKDMAVVKIECKEISMINSSTKTMIRCPLSSVTASTVFQNHSQQLNYRVILFIIKNNGKRVT